MASRLLAGIVLANAALRHFRRRAADEAPPLVLMADLSLGLFLEMSLMSPQLRPCLHVAGPLFMILPQITVRWGPMTRAVFRMPGGSYDTAVSDVARRERSDFTPLRHPGGGPAYPTRPPAKLRRAERLARHCEKTAYKGFPSLGIAL